MEIIGTRKVLGGNTIVAQNDHRIAMSFNLLNLFSEKPINVVGNESFMTSFPVFCATLKFLKK